MTLTDEITPTPSDRSASGDSGNPTGVDSKRRRTLLGFIATRRIVEIVLCLILGVGSGLLFYGANFGLDMVSSQLEAQDISFPAKGSPGLDPAIYPGLQQYAGQKVDTGPKAKAYANEFIAVHLEEASGGKTYSELSAAAQATPEDTELAGQVATMFKGETLRGLLLYGWGWSVVSSLALYAAIGALIGFLLMAAVTIGDFLADPRIAAHHIATD